MVVILMAGSACQFSDTLENRFFYKTPTKSNTTTGRSILTMTPTTTQTATITATQTVTQTAIPTKTLTLLPTETLTVTPTLTPFPTLTLTRVPTKQTTNTVPAPNVQFTNTPSSSNGGGGGCDGDDTDVEAQVLSLINSQRSSAGLGLVSSSSTLGSIARNYSRAMAEQGFFDHGDVWGRVNSSGAYTAVGEILYAGMGPDNNASAAVNAWLNSPTHREKMLNPIYTLAGVGYWCDLNSTYGGYYTVDFARP